MAINVINGRELDNKKDSILCNSLGALCQRVANVALPFLAMYKPFGLAMGVGSGAMKVFANVSNLTTAIKTGDTKGITFQAIQTAIAVASLASTLIAHPLGMLITTVNDVALDTFHMVKFIQAGEYQKATEKGFSILSNAVYLSVMLGGGLELSIASVALQILNGIYQSRTEFMKGNYIEALGHVAMVGIKSHQMAGQIQILHSKWKFEGLLKELAEKQKAQEAKTKQNKKMLACVQNKQLTAQIVEQKKAHEALITSAKSTNNEELIEILIKYGNNPKGIPAIQYAVLEKDYKAVNLLLEHGASVHTRDAYGHTCLFYAVLADDLILMSKFISLGNNPNERFSDFGPYQYWTMLEAAIMEHKNQAAKFLIDFGVDTDFDYRNIFNLSCRIGNLEILKYAFDKGLRPPEYCSNISVESYSLWNVFLAYEGNIQEKFDCLKFLDDHQLINLACNPENYHWIIGSMYPQALNFLFEKRYLDPNFKFSDNDPLFLQILRQNSIYLSDIMKILESHNVDFTLVYGSWNAFFWLVNQKYNLKEFLRQRELIEFFLAHNANINLKDSTGKTALDYASDEKMIDYLISKGAKKGAELKN